MTRATARYRRTASAVLATALAGISVAAGLSLAPAAQADAYRDKEYWLADSGITKAWEVSKGAGVKVAVIDSGIDAQHPDLKGAVTGGYDASGSGQPDGQKSIGAKPEHGTLVATMLAGRGHQTPGATPSPSPSASKGPAVGPEGRATRTRFPRRSAGPSTTAPASSISPSAAPPRSGRRAGTRPFCTPNKT